MLKTPPKKTVPAETTSNGDSILIHRSPLWHWWPLLLGPIFMSLVYWAYFNQLEALYHKKLHENLALIILPIAFISFLSCTLIYRRPLHLIFTVLTAALFCREWHFPGTSTGIYLALIAIGAWICLWRTKLAGTINEHLKPWIIATTATYILSQVIARRLFRPLHLPLEKQLHVPLEEVVETAAHLMLLTVSLLFWFYSLKKSNKNPAPNSSET
ncbi:MAG: hypothetical protein GY869_24920 [Planctomycetes bacterium]|nr:hypothetical protein [Planctomycetota bacterium]